ncbi:MAG: alkylation repair protein [Verrucomicrobiaceae bacterium]|nr:alkylation repair protein [Verrucomicrobiaceae bacterium]
MPALLFMLPTLRQDLRAQANPERAKGTLSFFKTGPGQYGEGDKFLGLTVPQTRAFVTRTDALTEQDILALLQSEWHEERLLALFALVRRFEKARKDDATQERLFDLYLTNTRWINNWDLVDTSAPQIVGGWLLNHDRSILVQLVVSPLLWERRIAVLATLTFIRARQFDDTLRLCRALLKDKHDLMQKSCGWMLREVGKKDEAVLTTFLDLEVLKMPRTMLRYAVERLAPEQRTRYLAQRAP